MIRKLLGMTVILAVILSGIPHIVIAATTIYMPHPADVQGNETLISPNELEARRFLSEILTQPTPARMSLQYLYIHPTKAYPGEPVAITINVVNSGDVTGQIYVQFKINEQVEYSRLVGVGPQTSMPLKLVVTKTEPGIYNVDVGGNRGRFTILAAKDSNDNPNLNNVLIAFLIGTLIIAAVMVVIIAFSHHK